MNTKQQILTMLREEFKRWEELLISMSEEQITSPHLPSNLSIKDVIAHLWVWQQRSISMLEATRLNQDPEFPGWPEEIDPELEDNLDRINAWIFVTHHDQPGSSVYRDWREGFLRFLELGEAIPDQELLDAGRYPWMDGHPLSLVLLGSYEHHHEEHLEPLLAWFRQQGEHEKSPDKLRHPTHP